MSTKEDVFKVWDYGHGSGEGSDPTYAKTYIDFVSTFVRENNVRTVVDLGCGDFRIGSSIDWGEATVVGVDASLPHITNHREKFKDDPRFSFIHADVRSFDASGFDLAVMKDVIQHWPTAHIHEWLASPRARLTLVTNDAADGGPGINGDISYPHASNGVLQVYVRGVDLAREPFLAPGRVLHGFRGKSVFLLE